MTHRQRAEAALARVPDTTAETDLLTLHAELRELHRKLRGGHNSVGHRPSVVALRQRLVDGAWIVADRLRALAKKKTLPQPYFLDNGVLPCLTCPPST